MAKRNPFDEAHDDSFMQEMLRAAQEAANKAKEQAKSFLLDNYEPGDDIREGITLTTAEVFSRLQSHVPSEHYTVTDVASWLSEEGFMTYDKGHMKFEWMLKKRALNG